MPQETFSTGWNSCALFQLILFKPFRKTISNSKTLGTNFDDINTWWVFSKVLTPRNQQVPSMLLWVKGCRWCKRWCNCRHFSGFLHAPIMAKICGSMCPCQFTIIPHGFKFVWNQKYARSIKTWNFLAFRSYGYELRWKQHLWWHFSPKKALMSWLKQNGCFQPLVPNLGTEMEHCFHTTPDMTFHSAVNSCTYNWDWDTSKKVTVKSNHKPESHPSEKENYLPPNLHFRSSKC